MAIVAGASGPSSSSSGGGSSLASAISTMRRFLPKPVSTSQVMSQTTTASSQILQNLIAAAQQMAGWSTGQMQQAGQQSINWASAATGQLNQAMASAYFSNLDYLSPGWKQTITGAAQGSLNDVTKMSQMYTQKLLPGMINQTIQLGQQTGNVASQLLQGKLPTDATAMARQAAAQASVSGGVFGQAAGAMTMRDLGLSSLQGMQMGAGMAGQAAQINQGAAGLMTTGLNMAAAPLTAATAYSNLLNSLMPPQVSAGALAGNALSSFAGAMTVSPSQIMSSGAGLAANAMSTASSIAGSNQQMAYQAVLGGASLYSNQQAANAQMAAAYAQQAANARAASAAYQAYQQSQQKPIGGVAPVLV